PTAPRRRPSPPAPPCAGTRAGSARRRPSAPASSPRARAAPRTSLRSTPTASTTRTTCPRCWRPPHRARSWWARGGPATARCPPAEPGAAVGTVFETFTDGDRRRERLAAMLDGAAPYVGTIAWGAMVGEEAARRAGARLAWWWRHPRPRRALVAAAGALGLPGVVP